MSATAIHSEHDTQSCNLNNKMKLSKSILEMKFMKRTKEKVEKQLYQEEGEEYFGSQLTTRMKKESGQFIIEPSFVFCEELIDGRLSFQGMNPDIERLMELDNNAKQTKLQKDKETDVSDNQMTKWKLSMKNKKLKTNLNKYIFNRSIPAKPDVKRRKFLKPVD